MLSIELESLHKRRLILLAISTIIVGLSWASSLFSKDIIPIFDQDGWKITKTYSDGMVVAMKPIPGSSLRGMQVSRIVKIQPGKISEVIMNINRYREFISNSKYLIDARQVSSDSTGVVGYHYMKVPIISDRHCFFQLNTRTSLGHPDTTRIEWVLIPETPQLAKYEHNDPSIHSKPVYMDYGAGSWICVPCGNNNYKITYRVYLNLGGSVPAFIVDLGQRAGVIGFFRDVIREAQKR